MDKYIYLSDKCKIINPCFSADVETYQGPLNDYNFEKQTNNYQKLVDIFNRYNIHFDYIWAAKFINECGNIISRFVVKSNCGRIYWRKYNSISQGSGQNYVYIDTQRFKTTKIIVLTDQELDNLLL